MGVEKKDKCGKCGNPQLVSDYNHKTEQLFEFCDVCGYYHSAVLTNMPKDGNYPADWNPMYDEREGQTGFILKSFSKDGKGYEVFVLEKKSVKEVIGKLRDEKNVDSFAVTFKDTLGNYQTQVYKKQKTYRVSYIDAKLITNINPNDAIRFQEVEADDIVDALKKVAISITDKDSPNIEVIKKLHGSLKDVASTLNNMKYNLLRVSEVKK